MLRRNSDYYKRRESIVIVQETRGLPFTYLTVLVAVLFLCSGIRDFFFCGTPLPWEDEHAVNYFDVVRTECRTNKHALLDSMSEGGWNILQGMIRLQLAFSVDTGVLYSSMQLVVFADLLLLFVLIRFDYSSVPVFYQFLVIGFVTFEIYLLLIARKAYQKRKAQRAAMKFE